jgi:hypothetical protein
MKQRYPNWAWALLLIAVVGLWDSAVLWPVRVLIVMFHELGHAVAAWVTGGSVIEIGLSSNEGGHTLTQGGSRLLILNAGYLGSLCSGIMLLAAARAPHVTRGIVAVLGLTLGTVTLGYVRPFLSFGFGYGIVVATLIMAVGLRTSTDSCRLVLRAIGLTSVLYAIFDVIADVFLIDQAQTDATMLAEATGVPAVLWGAVWLVISGAAIWFSRRWVL